MINWVSTEDLKITFMSFLQNRTEKELRNAGTFESMGRFKFSDEDIDTAIVQFRALGLIEENQRQWKLTKYGDYLMTQLRALHRSSSKGAESKNEKLEEDI